VKVWLTKKLGVPVEAEIPDDYDIWVALREGTDWHRTRESAIERALQMHETAYIAARKEVYRLEMMEII